jgi:hypothetical protein
MFWECTEVPQNLHFILYTLQVTQNRCLLIYLRKTLSTILYSLQQFVKIYKTQHYQNLCFILYKLHVTQNRCQLTYSQQNGLLNS